MSRMLYTDARGKIAIATAFNKSILSDVIKVRRSFSSSCDIYS